MLETAYSRFFYGLMKEFDISTEEAVFLMMVKELSKVKGYCFASRRQLAILMRVSPPTIYRWIKNLKRKGLLESIDYSDSLSYISYYMKTGCLKVTEEYDAAIEEIVKTYTKEDR
jgi:DNA-binding transcriptional regulator YhcF (GntR family)